LRRTGNRGLIHLQGAIWVSVENPMKAIKAKHVRVALAASAILGLTANWPARTQASNSNPNAEAQFEVSTLLGLPLSFEPNRGQSEAGVQFVARGPGYTLRLNHDGSSIQFSPDAGTPASQKSARFEIRLAGSNKTHSRLLGKDEQPSKSSYFTGSDPKKWLTGIPNFGRVERRHVYDGIDVSYRGQQGQFQCEFKIAPHAKPESIKLEIVGARHLHIDAKGDVVFSVGNVEVRLRRLDAHQEANGFSQPAALPVSLHYVVGKNLIAFRLGNYDPEKILLISPILSYADLSEAAENVSTQARIAPRSTSRTHASHVSHSNLNHSIGEVSCAGL
jgi:hypothetical protein